MKNRELALMGCLTRPLYQHPDSHIAACKSKRDAAYLSLAHCGLDQERIAEQIPMDAGHLSRMIRGGRPWNDHAQERFERITGSYALTQWDCWARGADFTINTEEWERRTFAAQAGRLGYSVQDRRAA